MMSTRDNRLPKFIILKNPWCHKSSVSKFLFGTSGHLQLLVTKTLRFGEIMLAGTGKAYQNQVNCRARLQRRANTPNLSVSREPYTCNTFPAFHSSGAVVSSQPVFRVFTQRSSPCGQERCVTTLKTAAKETTPTGTRNITKSFSQASLTLFRFLGHRSLIKNKTQTAVINVVNVRILT